MKNSIERLVGSEKFQLAAICTGRMAGSDVTQKMRYSFLEEVHE
jgi:hypothetical protein